MFTFSREKGKKLLINIVITILVNALAIGLMLVLNRQYIYEENIFLLFILAVLIIVIETKSIVYGIVSSIFLCSSFNFFLTDPQYSFVMDDINYYISFIVFIIISIIFGSIVVKLQNKVVLSKENERRINILYDLSKKLLNCHGSKEVFDNINSSLAKNLNFRFLLTDISNNKNYGNVEELSLEAKEAMDFSINQFTIVGRNQAIYSSSNFLVFPIRSKSYKFGAIYVDLRGEDIKNVDFSFIKSISTEAAVVLEREEAIKEQEISEHKVEKEHFKSTLLRSLSHDLKTPLTSIESGSLFLKENLDSLSKDETKELLDNIYTESVSLYAFVNNLLNISKMADKKSLVKVYESLDDIMENVKQYFTNIKHSQKIVFPSIDDFLLVYCNAQLIIQVFINLIGNALKYTKEDSTISVDVHKENNRLLASIEDDGGGIDEAKIKTIFDEEKRAELKKDSYRSSGLGLIICKNVVEAHNGSIEAFNNSKGGATFRFYIDLNKGKDHDTDN